tara:strand:- start:674 stop:2656 length:1983 start_codon:yes stop_codon:yes gene_type:complete
MANQATITVELRTKSEEFERKFKKATDTVKKGTDKVQKATKKASGAAAGFQDKFRRASQSIAAIQGPLGPVAGRLTSLGTIIGNVGIRAAVATLAVAALVFGLGKMVAAGAKAERQFKRLEGILRATGGAAGLSLLEIEELAQQIGKETLASTQEIRDAAGVLLTFKSITGDVFKEALKLSQDLAEVGFGSAKSAAMQLGKALEEPEIGLSALRRVGVSFSKSQKDLIKNFDFMGEKIKSQEIMLKALNEQVGGAGINAADGLSGALDTLNEEFTIFLENNSLTKIALEIVTGLMKGLNKVFGTFEGKIKKLNEAGLREELAKIDESLARMNKTFHESIMMAEDEVTLIDRMTKKQAERAIIIAKLEANQKSKNRSTAAANALAEKQSDFEILMEDQQRKRELATKREIQDLGKTEDELRKLNMERKIEDALLAKKITDQGVINTAIQQATTNIDLLATRTERFNEIQRVLDGLGDGVAKTFETTGNKIFDAFARGESGALNFKDILRQVFIDIQKLLFQILVMDRITKAIREGISGGGGISGLFTSLFTKGGATTATEGSHASGGTIQAGRPSLVGERGPELFVPGSAGVIKNNADTRSMMGGGGGGVNITQNLNFALGVTNTVRSEIANMLPTIQQSTISAVADAKLRGGKFAKAFGG